MRGLLITLGCVFAYILTGLIAARGLRLFELHNPKHPGRECYNGDCVGYSVGLWLGPFVLAVLVIYVVCRNINNLGRWVYTRPTWTERKQLRQERREQEAKRWDAIAAELEDRFPLCDHGEHGCTSACLKSNPPQLEIR